MWFIYCRKHNYRFSFIMGGLVAHEVGCYFIFWWCFFRWQWRLWRLFLLWGLICWKKMSRETKLKATLDVKKKVLSVWGAEGQHPAPPTTSPQLGQCPVLKPLPLWGDAILKTATVLLPFVHRHHIEVTSGLVLDHSCMKGSFTDTGFLHWNKNKQHIKVVTQNCV